MSFASNSLAADDEVSMQRSPCAYGRVSADYAWPARPNDRPEAGVMTRIKNILRPSATGQASVTPRARRTRGQRLNGPSSSGPAPRRALRRDPFDRWS